MRDEGELELAAVKSAFCLLTARWRLTQGEVRALLALEGGRLATIERVLPDELDGDAETRLRLIVRLDSALRPLFRSRGDMVDWLRSPAAAYDGRRPLEVFASLADLRAVLRISEGRNADGGVAG